MRYIVTINFTNGTDEREIVSNDVMTDEEAFRLALADMRAMPGPGFTGAAVDWVIDSNPPARKLIIATDTQQPACYVTPSVAAKIAAAGWRKLAIGIRREKSGDSTVPVFFAAHPSK